MSTEYEPKTTKDEEIGFITDDFEDVSDEESQAAHDDAAKVFMALNEDDFLKAILEAADYKVPVDPAVIDVTRGGKTLFQFRIRPLAESEFDRIAKKNTKYVMNRNLGYKMPQERNNVRYRSEIIYEATIEEDRKNLWDNKKAWSKLDILSGVDMVDKLLMAGEKDRIYDAIEMESGFSQEALQDVKPLEESAKN